MGSRDATSSSQTCWRPTTRRLRHARDLSDRPHLLLAQPSRKTICSGGTVRFRICPRRVTRVSKLVACPAGTGNNRSSCALRNAGKPARLTLPVSSRVRDSASRRNSLGKITMSSVSCARDCSRKPSSVASLAPHPLVSGPGGDRGGGQVVAQVHVQLGVERRIHPPGGEQLLVHRPVQFLDVEIDAAA